MQRERVALRNVKENHPLLLDNEEKEEKKRWKHSRQRLTE